MADSGLIYFEDLKYRKTKNIKKQSEYVDEEIQNKISLNKAVTEIMSSIWTPDEETGEALVSRINQLACENSLLKKEHINVAGALEEKEKENAISSTRADSLEEENEFLKDKIKGCEAEIASLESRCCEYGTIIRKLENDNKMCGRYSEIRVKYEGLEEKFYSAVESREKYLDRNVTLIRENKKLNLICGKLAKENQDLNEKLCTLNSQLNKIFIQKEDKENDSFEIQDEDNLKRLLENALQAVRKAAENAESQKKTV